MTKEELRQLWTLLTKLKKERKLDYIEHTIDVDFQEFEDDDWYDLDDGDNLIWGCDILLEVVEDLL